MRTRPISKAEYHKLLAMLPDEAACAVRLSADTGLRISDILALHASDIKPTMQVMERKTGKRRTVHLRRSTINACRQLRGNGKAHLLQKDRSTIYRQIKKAAKSLGYDNVSMHSLRKMYARNYCRAHGLAATQQEMQHDYLSTTMLYILSPEDVTQIIKKEN